VNAGEMIAINDVYLCRDPAIQMAILMQRDKRDIAGHSEKCPGAEAGNGRDKRDKSLRTVPCPAPSGGNSGADNDETEMSRMSRMTPDGGAKP